MIAATAGVVVAPPLEVVELPALRCEIELLEWSEDGSQQFVAIVMGVAADRARQAVPLYWRDVCEHLEVAGKEREICYASTPQQVSA